MAALTESEIVARARETYDFWRQAGLSHEQACGGPVGAQQRETSFRLPIEGDKRGSDPDKWAYGIFQWHWEPRGRDILKGCGIDIRTASNLEQNKAALWELQHIEKRAWAEIQAARSLEDCARAWIVFYERSADKISDLKKQVAFGRRWAGEFLEASL